MLRTPPRPLRSIPLVPLLACALGCDPYSYDAAHRFAGVGSAAKASPPKSARRERRAVQQPSCTDVHLPRKTIWAGDGLFPLDVLAVPLPGAAFQPAFLTETEYHTGQDAMFAKSPVTNLVSLPSLNARLSAHSVVQFCYNPRNGNVYGISRATQNGPEGEPVYSVLSPRGPWGLKKPGQNKTSEPTRIAMFNSPRDGTTDYVVAVADGALFRLAYNPDPAAPRAPAMELLADNVQPDSPLGVLVDSDDVVHVLYAQKSGQAMMLGGADAANTAQMKPQPLSLVSAKELLPIETPDGAKFVFYTTAAGELHQHSVTGTGDTQIYTEGAAQLRALWAPDGTRRLFFRMYKPDFKTGDVFPQNHLMQVVYTEALDRNGNPQRFWTAPLPVLSKQNLPSVPSGSDFEKTVSLTAVTVTSYSPFQLDDGRQGILAVLTEGPHAQKTVFFTTTTKEVQDYKPSGVFTYWSDYTRVAASENWPSVASAEYEKAAGATQKAADPPPKDPPIDPNCIRNECYEVMILVYYGSSSCALWDRQSNEFVDVIEPKGEPWVYKLSAERGKGHRFACYPEKFVKDEIDFRNRGKAPADKIPYPSMRSPEIPNLVLPGWEQTRSFYSRSDESVSDFTTWEVGKDGNW